MPADIDVANGALRLIGARRITAFDNASEEARQVEAAWPGVRQSVLRSHPWNFAMKRAAIPASVVSPPFGFTKAFPLPAGFLRVWEVPDLDASDWQVESGDDYGVPLVILANASAPLRIRYIADVDDPNKWDAMALDLLEAELAAAICERITNSSSVLQSVYAIRDERAAAARNIDGMENPPSEFLADEFVTARF